MSEPIPNSRRLKLTLEYDGTHYYGWQKQASGLPTVQNEVEGALSRLFDRETTVIASGRTDQGVHALGQVIHLEAPPNVERYKIAHASQALLPSDIVIKEAIEVDPRFHAQHSALSKTYCYRICNRPTPSAVQARFSLWVSRPLDLELLNLSAKALLGEHDFASFRSRGTPVKSTVRTIYRAEFTKVGDFVEFRINGTGFLKQMVRNIVGTLLDIHWDRRPPGSLVELIGAKDRTQAGMAVPPQGLFLEKVYYPPELDKPLRNL